MKFAPSTLAFAALALPARAFIGAGSLLGGARFEGMGIAVKATQ
jgi:hypothetical protein